MSLIFNHVSYEYDSNSSVKSYALKDINLTIEDGGFYGLIGHTGSGKSTLVQHMNGLLHPTSGEVYYAGADIADKDYDLRALQGWSGIPVPGASVV